MKTRTLFGLFLLSSIAAAGDSPAQVRAAVQQQMNLYVSAMKKKDGAAIEKVILANFAPDFKDVDIKGKARSRDETIQTMKQNISSFKSISNVSLRIVKMTVSGDKATSSEVFKLDGLIGGSGKAKTAKIQLDLAWIGTYIKRNGRWLCTQSKSTKERVLINGKPVPN
jgi:hypothetical protein